MSAQATDGGRNEFYEGCFECEDSSMRDARLIAAWKSHAQELEELNHKFMDETNGPTHMGEPVLQRPDDVRPVTMPNLDGDWSPISAAADQGAFALEMLVAGGFVSQEKVESALRTAAKIAGAEQHLDRTDAERYRYLRDRCSPMEAKHHLEHSPSDCDSRIDRYISVPTQGADARPVAIYQVEQAPGRWTNVSRETFDAWAFEKQIVYATRDAAPSDVPTEKVK